jgi:hypothetical protein
MHAARERSRPELRGRAGFEHASALRVAASRFLLLLLLLPVRFAFVMAGAPSLLGAVLDVDVCIYGGSACGVAAALQCARMGRTSVLVEPGAKLGGLSSGGLGATDIGNKGAIGGIAREFYQRVARHYDDDGGTAWRYETRAEYFAKRRSSQVQAADAASLGRAERTMWTFEPHVAQAIFDTMAREARTQVLLRSPLAAVERRGRAIREIRTENGHSVRARMFIDSSYEGDLMALAGVAYTVGREANATYGETLNGVRLETPKHQFLVPVDPYIKPGDPASGLLPEIDAEALGAPGSGDRRVQAYNYRLCFTTNASNRLPIEPPDGYDPARYEMLARYVEALGASGRSPRLDDFWHPIWLPNQKTDINNNGAFSTDFIGANYDYPEASHTRRRHLAQAHQDYIRGLLTFLATNPRVPASIRGEVQRWGPCKDEFIDTGGWPHALYVREARRLLGARVVTEHECLGRRRADDPIGLAAYNMDSHNVRRLVRNGRVENEGDVQVPPAQPYGIPFGAVLPKATELANLLVPVCLSASHIAYGSIRMEPVFMILGQSAATAACLALDQGVALHDLPYPQLRARLLADRQVLAWPPGSD